jgi:hypothetical protein
MPPHLSHRVVAAQNSRDNGRWQLQRVLGGTSGSSLCSKEMDASRHMAGG